MHVTTSKEDNMKECWRPTLKEHPGLFNEAVNSEPVTDVLGVCLLLSEVNPPKQTLQNNIWLDN